LILGLVFWLGLLFLAYVEFGYLVLLWLVARLRSTSVPESDSKPSVTLLIAAHNEAQVIGQKIENTLALSYPRDKLQVIVVSDGSEDGTAEITRTFSSGGIQIHAFPRRQGKVPALRAVEDQIRGDVVVFSDADSMYQPDAIDKLVRPFANPQVGAVSGHEVRHAAGAEGKGEGLYCRIDNWIKALEGQVGSQVMVNGGFFAIRRHLMPHVPDHLTHDGIVPPSLFLQGYRTAYASDALSFEAYSLDSREDWRRRIRTVLQAVQSYLYVPSAMNPLRTGFYALQIWSHRFFRWLVFPVLLILLLTNVLLIERSPLYAAMALCQVVCYLFAAVGLILDRFDRRPVMFYFPFYFLYLHAAAFLALVLALSGRTMTTWRPTKRHLSIDKGELQ